MFVSGSCMYHFVKMTGGVTIDSEPFKGTFSISHRIFMKTSCISSFNLFKHVGQYFVLRNGQLYEYFADKQVMTNDPFHN